MQKEEDVRIAKLYCKQVKWSQVIVAWLAMKGSVWTLNTLSSYFIQSNAGQKKDLQMLAVFGIERSSSQGARGWASEIKWNSAFFVDCVILVLTFALTVEAKTGPVSFPRFHRHQKSMLECTQHVLHISTNPAMLWVGRWARLQKDVFYYYWFLLWFHQICSYITQQNRFYRQGNKLLVLIPIRENRRLSAAIIGRLLNQAAS